MLALCASFSNFQVFFLHRWLEAFERGLFFYLQVAPWQPVGWDDPSSNICPGQARQSVRPHFFFYLMLVTELPSILV